MKDISDKKALKHNTIALMIIQILNYVLPFITLPYVARIFRVEDYGVVFFAQVMMDYFLRFIMFGFDLSAVRQMNSALPPISTKIRIFTCISPRVPYPRTVLLQVSR